MLYFFCSFSLFVEFNSILPPKKYVAVCDELFNSGCKRYVDQGSSDWRARSIIQTSGTLFLVVVVEKKSSSEMFLIKQYSRQQQKIPALQALLIFVPIMSQ
jgi:hypothetical protein